jgi:hypothetical protein
MTVACGTHGIEVARKAGLPDAERELLEVVLNTAKTAPSLSEESDLVNLVNLRR